MKELTDRIAAVEAELKEIVDLATYGGVVMPGIGRLSMGLYFVQRANEENLAPMRRLRAKAARGGPTASAMVRGGLDHSMPKGDQ